MCKRENWLQMVLAGEKELHGGKSILAGSLDGVHRVRHLFFVLSVK